MSLTERIERRQPNENIVPLVERRQQPQPPVPVWIRRMQQGQLPAKDMSERRAA
jgi:hypothetical protein